MPKKKSCYNFDNDEESIPMSNHKTHKDLALHPAAGFTPFKNIVKQLTEHNPGILSRKIRDFGLKLEGSSLEGFIQKLYRELEDAGIHFKPACYLSDEWGCPHGIPVIGIPFYLVDHELSKIEKEMMEEIEGENEDEIMKLLRHEAGHAMNYAFQFFRMSAWRKIFGKISQPYSDNYRPNPFSRKFVKHLDNWYAQKHPDDDFAETFAVWLTPGSDWGRRYKGWGAYKKLFYVSKLMKRHGSKQPKVTATLFDEPVEEMDITLQEYYLKKMDEMQDQLPNKFDADLEDIFCKEDGHDGMKGSVFIKEHRAELVNTIANWTGEKKYMIRMLLRELYERADQLELFVQNNAGHKTLTHLIAYCTTLTMNYRYLGRFFIY
ncbi:MAG: putative zinc-binding metallopeptidase [Chlamydiota bacterium]|nr:putative zinc-binding metallopeptidase [Chlamydiota bacterium]